MFYILTLHSTPPGVFVWYDITQVLKTLGDLTV